MEIKRDAYLEQLKIRKDAGAYGEHGPTTVGLSGHKSIPLYGKAEA